MVSYPSGLRNSVRRPGYVRHRVTSHRATATSSAKSWRSELEGFFIMSATLKSTTPCSVLARAAGLGLLDHAVGAHHGADHSPVADMSCWMHLASLRASRLSLVSPPRDGRMDRSLMRKTSLLCSAA